MIRKKLFLIAAIMSLFVAVGVWAADVAFIYPSEEIVLSGKPVFGSVVAEGVLAPADVVLAAGGEVLVGLPGEAVKKASLVRLDKDLNVALLRVGERVVNPELQAAHRKRGLQLQSFLPTQNINIASNTAEVALLETGEALVSSGAPVFLITFNKAPLSKNVVHFKPFLSKAKFSVELVSISTEPFRDFTFRIHANPKLGFWNRDQSSAPTDAPHFTYEYKYNSFLSPIKAGKKFALPLEAHYINAKDYELILEVEAPGHIQREKVFVHFD